MGSIRFLTGPLAGITRQINTPVVTIGREPTNDIVIADPSVSRQHARLVNDGGQWSIEKLARQNVVTVNQRSVQQAIISDRDTIGIGTSTTFLFLTSPELAGMVLSQPVSALSPQQLPPRNASQPPFEPTQAVGVSSLSAQQAFTRKSFLRFDRFP